MERNQPSQARRPVVFLHDFVDFDLGLERVRTHLFGDGDWLAQLAHRAGNDGEAVLAGDPSPSASRRAATTVRLGDPHAYGAGVLIAIRWEAEGFPLLDGNLELAPISATTCRLALSASFRPAPGNGGLWPNAISLQRVAETTVRSFLVSVADAIYRGRLPKTARSASDAGSAPSAEKDPPLDI